MKQAWETLFGKEMAYFDGGMGTLLQSMGLQGGERPETWNLRCPEKVKSIHQAYLRAGARVVTANTFGAAASHLGPDAAKYMEAGVRLAKEAVTAFGGGYAAIDMGSLGRLPQPYGDMPFEDAVTEFRDAFTAGVRAGGDLILIETMTDLLEVRACVLAAREAMERCRATLPLFVSLTFDERGRLLSGADIPGTVAMLTGLRVDAIGLNCGHEPKALRNNVKELLACCPLPVFVSPNASLPVVTEEGTVFPTGPEEFAQDMAIFADWGAWGLGGCCGTTPAHIAAVVAATKQKKPVRRDVPERCVISGVSKSVVLGQRPVLIGERLNPTGKKRMKEALRENDADYLLREAVAQIEAGADALDVNVGLPEIDEKEALRWAVQAVQTVCDLPLQLDTANPEALQHALRGYAGKPLINSVCGKQDVMDAVFPLAAKYGGAVVALCLDESGIPADVEGRLRVARRMISEAGKYGIAKYDLLFDALTMTVATDEQAARVTLETVRALHDQLGVKTVLGVSNVSFGLPQRPLLTAAFLAMALYAGLDAAIMNPGDRLCRAMFAGGAAISGKDPSFATYIQDYGAAPLLTVAGKAEPQRESIPQEGDALAQAIRRGMAGDAAALADQRLSGGEEPLALLEASLMPALGRVGEEYEKGTLFLPQLLQCAAAAQAAFERVRARLPESESAEPGKKIVLATVKGDVHDIGKNIVKALLQNYGFSVIDLGRDVAPEAVLEAVRESGARMAGLSALMTTTVPAMKETVALLHREAPGVRVVVGGAVLNEDYARQIGADGYGRDAMASVRLCQEWSR